MRQNHRSKDRFNRPYENELGLPEDTNNQLGRFNDELFHDKFDTSRPTLLPTPPRELGEEVNFGAVSNQTNRFHPYNEFKSKFRDLSP